MKAMTVQELYDYLNSQEFRKSENIFYNYYLYQYPARDEYKMRRDIGEFKEKLKRPTSYINALALDMFSVFCDYLKSESFGDKSLLEDTFEQDTINPAMATQELTAEANSDSFIRYIRDRIEQHLSEDDGLDKPYVFVYGMGKMYPYLRTNVFLTKYEQYNDTSRYKIILFYPGHQEGNGFALFDFFDDSHTYRATLLVNK